MSFAEKNILITGGSGFIGSNLARDLLAQKANVQLFVRQESDLWRLKDINSEINKFKVNPSDFDSILHAMNEVQPHYIFHFAQPASNKYLTQRVLDFQQQLSHTYTYLINLLEAARENQKNLVSFVQACSSYIYRWAPDKYLLHEKTPFDPTTLRGIAKLNERNICMYFARQKKLPINIARIFRAYGPWDSGQKLIVTALRAARLNQPFPVANSCFKRDYIFTKDLTEGILLLAKSNLPTGTEMNFGSGQQFSALEIIETMENILGTEIPKITDAYPPNPYDKGNFLADISLAKNVLGWQPGTSIDEGLRQTIEWYKTFHAWQP